MTQMYKQAHMAATVAAPPPPQHPQTPVPTIIHPHNIRTPGPHPHYAQSPTHYPPATPLQRHPSNQPGMPYPQQQQQGYPPQHPGRYNPPATPFTFTLPESVTHSIPEETAERFLRDAHGQLLWFAYPPQDNAGARPRGEGVGHSVQYLARRKELEVRREARARQREGEAEELKRKREVEREEEQKAAKRVLVKALGLMGGRDVVA